VKKLQEDIAALKSTLEREQEEKAAVAQERDNLRVNLSVIEPELDAVKTELGAAKVEIDAAKLELEQLPAKLEETKSAAILEFRKSDDLGEDLDLIMQQAFSGGYARAIDAVKRIYPEAGVEVDKLEEPWLYNPDYEKTYDLYFEEFQQGVSLSQKYGQPTDATTSETVPLSTTDAASSPTPEANS
jgi:regulator of replication initiation timing